MATLPTEQIVLAQTNNQSQGYRPRLVEFYGYEGEDFRHFQELLDSYLVLSNTHSDARKLAILRSQLRRAAKMYFEKVILKDRPQVTYDEAIELLKNYYITPELIQNYELEFNEMAQGEQEHPQIFLARLREAADLANITSEAVIESRYRAGLLKEIKLFCIQSSARNFQDWVTHSEGWWNANRPRKIAMVDNPFIPRNVNNALIYHDDNYHSHHTINNHNIELIDAGERPTQVIPLNELHPHGVLDTGITNHHAINGSQQLSTLEVTRNNYHAQTYPQQARKNKVNYHNQVNEQQNLVDLIQQTIRNELNNQQQQPPARNYNRRNRYQDNYQNYNQNGNLGGHSNNSYNNNGYNNNYPRNNYNNQGWNKNSYSHPPYRSQHPQQNGQSNNQNLNKSINNHPHNLNALLTQNEIYPTDYTHDLFAAVRPDFPPEVTTANPYEKPIKSTRERGRRTTTKAKSKENNMIATQPMVTPPPIATQRHIVAQPIAVATQPTVTLQPEAMETDQRTIQKNTKSKTLRKKTKAPPLEYDIVSDVMNQKADISFKNLIVAAPALGRKLAAASRPKRIPVEVGNHEETMAMIEDEEINTTAVSYKNKKAELEITFLRKTSSVPKISSYTQGYEKPVSLTNSEQAKHVHFEDELQDEDSSDQDDESTEEEDSAEEELEDEQTETLLLLENEKEDDIQAINQGTDILLEAPQNGLTVPSSTSKTIWIKKPKNEQRNLIYNLEITNPKVINSMGCFDSCLNLITNRKSLEIRIFNRSPTDMSFDPGEEIGIIEKISPESDTIIQAYELDSSPQLCMIETTEFALENEMENNNKLLESEKYKKLDIGMLDAETMRNLRKLLKKYENIFDWDNNTIGRTNLLKHKITIKEDTMPISHRPYRISPLEAEHLQKELDKYCKLGVIEPSNSPWAAPVILVKKKNGEYRMVIDYRKLNAVTKKDAYPLPRIDDLLDTLGKAKVFSALDMRAGFHQVPMEEDSKELTAFTTKYGTYHYNTLPMGLVNSPATFQRLIDLCFRPLMNQCLVAYIDDLNVYSLNKHEHLQHLEQVFQCVQIANLKLNPEKCFFFKDHLKFLGYIVTKEGLQTDPSKIQKIVEYPQPKTIKQVRGFLGIASYYRRFIKNFAAIARPLHDQTKTTKKVPWTNETTESFELLKRALTSTPILSRPDFNKPFILITDASKLGLGAILTQLDDNGYEHPVIYASRGLKSTESNYAPTKLECLAVIWAVKLFRPYVLGKKFTIITDHSALNGLLKTPNPTGIIARWITILSEYEFEIKYRPGRVNESADFLSRLGY
ncbi:hypothetical protein G6F44_010170 [Rhizopus delemar]|nr:hypothetical protein G6F44_010170 [Rhizopus delemar]